MSGSGGAGAGGTGATAGSGNSAGVGNSGGSAGAAGSAGSAGNSSGGAAGSAGAGGGSSGGAGGKLIWSGDFETGDLSQYVTKLYQWGHVEPTNAVTRSGKYAALMWTEAQPTSGNTPYRAELRSEPRGKFGWDDGIEYWIGFSFRLDKWDPKVPANTFFQIHAPNEASGSNCDFDGNAITVRPSSGNLTLTVIENGGQSTGKGAGSNTTKVWSEPLKSDVWHDWVVHFTLSTKNAGFFDVWKDGQPIYSKTGLTNVNWKDSCGNPIPAQKQSHNGPHVGIYAPNSKNYPATLRRMYYDEVRMATGTNAYDLVAPK